MSEAGKRLLDERPTKPSLRTEDEDDPPDNVVVLVQAQSRKVLPARPKLPEAESGLVHAMIEMKALGSFTTIPNILVTQIAGHYFQRAGAVEHRLANMIQNGVINIGTNGYVLCLDKLQEIDLTPLTRIEPITTRALRTMLIVYRTKNGPPFKNYG